jgi:hypothetical protein
MLGDRFCDPVFDFGRHNADLFRKTVESFSLSTAFLGKSSDIGGVLFGRDPDFYLAPTLGCAQFALTLQTGVNGLIYH